MNLLATGSGIDISTFRGQRDFIEILRPVAICAGLVKIGASHRRYTDGVTRKPVQLDQLWRKTSFSNERLNA